MMCGVWPFITYLALYQVSGIANMLATFTIPTFVQFYFGVQFEAYAPLGGSAGPEAGEPVRSPSSGVGSGMQAALACSQLGRADRQQASSTLAAPSRC